MGNLVFLYDTSNNLSRDDNGHRPQRVCHYQTQTCTKFKLQIHPQPAAGFNLKKKTHPQRVLTITKPAMVSDKFFVDFRI